MSKPLGSKVSNAAQEFMKQRSFVHVVRTGGISSAARLLGLTPSAVSKNILRLEAELGAQLFARDNRTMVATARGMQAFTAWSELLIRLDQIQQELTAPESATGQLALSLPSGALPWLAPLLASYRKEFPLVQLRLNVSDDYTDLVRDRNDVALRLGRLKDSSERAVSLGSTPLVVCAAPAYFARLGMPLHADELAKHEGVLFRLPDSGRPRPISLRTGCVAWQALATTDDGHSLVQAALAGIGLIQAPLLLLNAELTSGRLVEALREERPAPLDVSLVFQSSSWLPAPTRAFIDMAKAWMPPPMPRA